METVCFKIAVFKRKIIGDSEHHIVCISWKPTCLAYQIAIFAYYGLKGLIRETHVRKVFKKESCWSIESLF